MFKRSGTNYVNFIINYLWHMFHCQIEYAELDLAVRIAKNLTRVMTRSTRANINFVTFTVFYVWHMIHSQIGYAELESAFRITANQILRVL